MNSVRTRAILVAALLSALAFASWASASANSDKPYAVIICTEAQTNCNPAVVGPAATAAPWATPSVTFRNDVSQGNTNIQLGSDNLNVPSALPGFSVEGVLQSDGTALPGCPAKLSQTGPTCWSSLNGGSTIGFRNLNLGPGQSATFTIQLATPAPSTTACTTASPCPWTDQAKQSNDFSGTGNGLNSDSNSAYGTVLAAVAQCPKNNGCSTTLGNGGVTGGAGGSITVTITTSSGKKSATQIESLDYGQTLDSSLCSNITALNDEYDNLSSGGSDRSQTITITTTDYPGYVAEVCNASNKPFTAKVVDANDNFVPPLEPATATTLPDGSAGYQGLLPDCGTSPLAADQVNCSKNPGVLSRSTSLDGTTHTIVIAVPPGFDAFHYN
jgi:hypothetical protein